MARRWRCPPETLVPPWVMGESSCSGFASTKSRACATSSASHTSASVASGLPKRTLLPTVPENRKGFWGTNPMTRSSSSRVEVADVDAADRAPAPPVTSNSRAIDVEQRGLARAGAADDRRGSRPASTRKLMSRSTGCSAPGNANSAWRSSSDAAPGSSVTPSIGRHDRRSTCRAPPRCGPAHTDARGPIIDDQRAHHHGHQDLDEVAQERDERADLHVAGVDAVGAEPDRGDAREVDGEQHRREHDRHHPAGLRATSR